MNRKFAVQQSEKFAHLLKKELTSLCQKYKAIKVLICNALNLFNNLLKYWKIIYMLLYPVTSLYISDEKNYFVIDDNLLISLKCLSQIIIYFSLFFPEIKKNQ